MNWKAKIFKPDWESRKTEKRLNSVTRENSQGLWNALPGIISSDPDYTVRLAAFKRLISTRSSDPLKRFEFILKQLNSLPANGDVEDPQANPGQQQYFEKYKQQLSQHIQRDLLKLTIDHDIAAEWLADNASAKDIEVLAKRASSINVRLAALGQIKANGLLGDLAIKETEPSLRRLAVSRIEQTSTLERVAKAIRTRDKKLYQQIQERLFESADHNAAVTTEHQSENICGQLEQLLKAVGTGVRPDPAELQKQWENLTTPASSSQQQRYQTLLNTLTTALDGSAVKPLEPAPDKNDNAVPVSAEIEKATAVVVEKADDKAEKERKATADKLVAAQKKRAEERILNQQNSKLSAENINTKQDVLATAIEAVDLNKAVKLLQQIRQDIAGLRKNRMAKPYLVALEGRQSRLHGKVKALRDYQHWANNKIRSEMITELQSMPTVDLHPDAVKNLISDARKKWQALEASEQLPGDKIFHAPASLWKEFNQTCDLAFKLIQPYLEKRNAIQDDHLQEDQQLLAEGEELLQAEDNTAKALIQQQRKLRVAIRALDKIPAKQRGKTARLIRGQLDKLQAKIGTAFEEIETEKSRIIRQAEQLLHIEDKQQAINQAKQLQRQWQASGSGKRQKEQAMWEVFRSHIDPLFRAQADQQIAEKEASKKQLAELKDLCSQLEEIGKLDAQAVGAQSGKVQSIKNDWQELASNSLHQGHKLNLRFQKAVDSYQNALQSARQQLVLQERKNWQIKNRQLILLHEKLLAKPEKSDAVIEKAIKKWPIDKSTSAIDKLLDKQLQNIQERVKEDRFEADHDTSESKLKSNLEQYRDLCLTLEYLAGLESPKAEKQQRMDMQIKRLAGNLSGEVQRMPLVEELSNLETSWYQLPVIASDLHAKYCKRFERAVAELLTQIDH